MKLSSTLTEKACPNCGAPVNAEICLYCGAATHIQTLKASSEYPVAKCREAVVNFWTVGFPGMFTIIFGASIPFIASQGTLSSRDRLMLSIICTVFTSIALISAIIVIRNVVYHTMVKAVGIRVTGTVYGYMNDKHSNSNKSPAQIIKILVNNNKQGPMFILYKSAGMLKHYKVGTQLILEVYRERFRIVGEKYKMAEYW